MLVARGVCHVAPQQQLACPGAALAWAAHPHHVNRLRQRRAAQGPYPAHDPPAHAARAADTRACEISIMAWRECHVLMAMYGRAWSLPGPDPITGTLSRPPGPPPNVNTNIYAIAALSVLPPQPAARSLTAAPGACAAACARRPSRLCASRALQPRQARRPPAAARRPHGPRWAASTIPTPRPAAPTWDRAPFARSGGHYVL